MKKVLALTFVLLLVLALVACGGSKTMNNMSVEATEKATEKPKTSYSNNNYSSGNSSITHYCEASGCTREGVKKYEGYAGTEYYCETHYDELMKTLGKMESDVGSGAYSKHQCEVCSKEGTHEIIGISGQKEYYCSEHYYEMQEWIDGMN